MIRNTIGTSSVDCAYQLGTGERLDFARDFMEVLTNKAGEEVDTLIQVDWTYEPDDGSLTFENQYISGQIAGVFISTPTPAKGYRITATARTAANRVYEVVIAIGGIQKSGIRPTT